MAKQTHLFLNENDRTWLGDVRAVDVVCGKDLVDPANAERNPAYVGCQKCLGRIASAFERFGWEIYHAVIGEKVAADREVQRAARRLREQFADTLKAMKYGIENAEREAARLDGAVAAGTSFTGPLDVAMALPRAALNALNNVRTDLLASYGAALEAEIARARKEA